MHANSNEYDHSILSDIDSDIHHNGLFYQKGARTSADSPTLENFDLSVMLLYEAC